MWPQLVDPAPPEPDEARLAAVKRRAGRLRRRRRTRMTGAALAVLALALGTGTVLLQGSDDPQAVVTQPADPSVPSTILNCEEMTGFITRDFLAGSTGPESLEEALQAELDLMLPRYPHGATDLDRQGPPRLVTAPGATATKRTVLVYDEQPNPGAAVHFENPGTGWRSTGSSKCSEFVRKYGEDAEREAATPSTVIIDFDDPAYRPEGLAACLLGAELWDGEPVAVFEHPDDPNLVVCWADGSVPKAPPPDADGTVRAPFDRVVFTATRDGNVVEMLRAGYRDQMQVTPP